MQYEMFFICEPQNFLVGADCKSSIKAAELFAKEMLVRTGTSPKILSTNEAHISVCFFIDENINNKDTYIITFKNGAFTFTAKTIRGLIFAYSHFLRKCVFTNGNINLTENICGEHSPKKPLRGHQVGYRTTPNTYDAWDYDQYYRYYLDMMAFGTNICEHNGTKPDKNFRNCLMKYEQYEFLREATRLADTLDLDVSLWHANDDKETEQEALANRRELYASLPRLDYVFVPGGDPGNMEADAFITRCKKITHILNESHPNAQLHPSAQAPHSIKNWGDVFVEGLKDLPDEFSTVIMGPNHAFPIHELREKVPSKYPLRFYPDITHNLRCEYPVNFTEDDWHYAFASTLSRESVNPRPTEFKKLNRIFSQYTIGGVSYSEGVHDDVNKMIWSALEWNDNQSLKDILLDYARMFLYNSNEEKIADTILLMEKSWEADPYENPCIDIVYTNLCALLESYPHLSENWRFMLLYFRGCCDKLIKMRYTFENALIKTAYSYMLCNDIPKAEKILTAPFTDEYTDLRNTLDAVANKLFNLIGIQLDVENYHADSWERGATLDTIDNNITDRAYLLNKLQYAKTLSEDCKVNYLYTLVNRNTVNADEVYYSIALHNLTTTGTKQNGEFYMDIQGDRPYTKETPLPMSMTKLYDHFTFSVKFGGFTPNQAYNLTIVYKTDPDESIEHHKITANGIVVYEGNRYGGSKNTDFDKKFLVDGFESATYNLPPEVFKNGALELEISEPTQGFRLCEMWIKRKN